MPLGPSQPTTASYPSEGLTIGAGVAIFHLATARVVVCHHSRDGYWFLPKGRRDADEATRTAAEREGFEESGYRNRVLPLPMLHRQPLPNDIDAAAAVRFVTEPLWTQLMPLSRSKQYLLFWFAAETIGEEVEALCDEAAGEGKTYCAPPAFPKGLTLRQRIAQDVGAGKNGVKAVYEPRWHDGTGVSEDEALYRSYLLPIDEARKKLRGSVMEDVVRRGWEGIMARIELEDEDEKLRSLSKGS